MNHSVYVLYSLKDKKLYVGQTNNLEKRFKLHLSGEIEATKHRQPLEIIYQENFATRGEAMTRERFLKSLWGAREKRKILDNYLKTRS